MKFIADLHIHSRYSRATSPDLTLENLWVWSQYKGIKVIGTGDCVHPRWFAEIREKLEPAQEGFFQLKPGLAGKLQPQVPESCRDEARFVLSTEISCIYKKKDKVRKVHVIVIFRSMASVCLFRSRLDAIGNIRSDGRPILGMDARDLLAIALECDPKVLFIPAHIWTPWFSVLGAKSGFDSIQECFEDLTPHIFALETGLSSDPPMNDRLEQLDDFILVSNSDAHSASKLGREANIFDTDFSYDGMYRALGNKKDNGFKGTIEFFPQEGKYYFDGHRACNVCLHPEKTARYKGLCPVCQRPVTVGVLSRVGTLATRPELKGAPFFSVQESLRNQRVFYSIVPLVEIIAEVLGVGPQSKKAEALYFNSILKLGAELDILMNRSLKDINIAAGEPLAAAIGCMRAGKVSVTGGYDGEYGVIQCVR